MPAYQEGAFGPSDPASSLGSSFKKVNRLDTRVKELVALSNADDMALQVRAYAKALLELNKKGEVKLLGPYRDAFEMLSGEVHPKGANPTKVAYEAMATPRDFYDFTVEEVSSFRLNPEQAAIALKYGHATKLSQKDLDEQAAKERAEQIEISKSRDEVKAKMAKLKKASASAPFVNTAMLDTLKSLAKEVKTLNDKYNLLKVRAEGRNLAKKEAAKREAKKPSKKLYKETRRVNTNDDFLKEFGVTPKVAKKIRKDLKRSKKK